MEGMSETKDGGWRCSLYRDESGISSEMVMRIDEVELHRPKRIWDEDVDDIVWRMKRVRGKRVRAGSGEDEENQMEALMSECWCWWPENKSWRRRGRGDRRRQQMREFSHEDEAFWPRIVSKHSRFTTYFPFYYFYYFDLVITRISKLTWKNGG